MAEDNEKSDKGRGAIKAIIYPKWNWKIIIKIEWFNHKLGDLNLSQKKNTNILIIIGLKGKIIIWHLQNIMSILSIIIWEGNSVHSQETTSCE